MLLLDTSFLVELEAEYSERRVGPARHLPQRLSENDAWMAATALTYNADLVGRERSFSRVPRLRYVSF